MAETPIIPGFYPDPSICRADGRYVIANSSFQYLPGIPLHDSRDLLHWRPVGHAFTRREQLDLRGAPANAGLYAPTIRFRDGLFYVVTSDLMSVADGHLIVHAEDPAGPWSDPVRVPGTIGIDPDLFWDDDGTCHLSWKGRIATGEEGIFSVPIDPLTGERTGPQRSLWQGTGGLASPEGPHLYRRGDYYYCLLAEGGTERTHCVTIARARSLDGPWEEHPANPILTHRGTPSPVQNVGHADLVETETGEWVAVYLAVRPRGFVPKFHVNGRETFLADVSWVDDWPVIDESRAVPVADTSFVDDFPGPDLDPRWISPGGVHADATEPIPGGGLRVHPTDLAGTVPVVAVRARDEAWRAEAELHPDAADGAALLVHMDERNAAEIVLSGVRATATLTIAGLRVVLGETTLAEPAEALVVAAEPWPAGARGEFNRGPDQVVLSVRTAAGASEVGRFDGRLLSTEVTAGFTGRVIGVRATQGDIVVRRLSYAAGAPAEAAR